MSSHHIVREKQEPALYIHKLGNFDEENLGQLLEWSPTLLVSAAAYEKVISMGLKVDVVVNYSGELSFQENTKTINVNSEEVSAVLDYLINEKYPAVNVIDTARNLDNLLAFSGKIDLVVLTESHKSYTVKSGFRFWKPAETILTIQSGLAFQYTNLQEIDNNQFRVITDGFVEFTFNSPYLAITEEL